MSDGNKLLSDVSCKYGAPMGRIRIADKTDVKVRLFRMRMADGAYDVGGAYWGCGTPLYAAIGEGFQWFTRAANRTIARKKLLEEFPDVQVRASTQLEPPDHFTNEYIRAALWVETDEDESPLDAKYTVADIERETLAQMIEDCRQFQEKYGHLFTKENCPKQFDPVGYAAHDLWLTRSDNGCGYWDGDWEEPAATILTEAAKEMGEMDLVVYEGKIYGS